MTTTTAPQMPTIANNPFYREQKQHAVGFVKEMDPRTGKEKQPFRRPEMEKFAPPYRIGKDSAEFIWRDPATKRLCACRIITREDGMETEDFELWTSYDENKVPNQIRYISMSATVSHSVMVTLGDRQEMMHLGERNGWCPSTMDEIQYVWALSARNKAEDQQRIKNQSPEAKQAMIIEMVVDQLMRRMPGITAEIARVHATDIMKISQHDQQQQHADQKGKK